MHGKDKQDGCPLDSRAEHLVVLQVAGVARGRTHEQVRRALRNLGAQRVDDAIASLAAVGVVIATKRSVRQSAALERIDRLDFIGACAMTRTKSEAALALGKAVREMRVQHGYSQEAFAAHAELDRSYYGAIERGEFNVRLSTIVKLTQALDTSLYELARRARL